MSSAVAELDGMLQAMLNLKPPGVNQNNVKAMQALCTANIQVRHSVITDSLSFRSLIHADIVSPRLF